MSPAEKSLSDALGQAQADLAASQTDLSAMQRHRDQLQEDVDHLQEDADALTEAMPCGWCDGVGAVPAERFGRDADGAPVADEDGPCPAGCEVAPWLQAERNDAADVERERDQAREELAWQKQVVGMLRKNEEVRARVIRERNRERDLLKAELSSARTEIDRLNALLEHAEQHSRDLQDNPPG